MLLDVCVIHQNPPAGGQYRTAEVMQGLESEIRHACSCVIVDVLLNVSVIVFLRRVAIEASEWVSYCVVTNNSQLSVPPDHDTCHGGPLGVLLILSSRWDQG